MGFHAQKIASHAQKIGSHARKIASHAQKIASHAQKIEGELAATSADEFGVRRLVAAFKGATCRGIRNLARTRGDESPRNRALTSQRTPNRTREFGVKSNVNVKARLE